MPGGQLLLCSFSSVDIGFHTITFKECIDFIRSLHEDISLKNTNQGIGALIRTNSVFLCPTILRMVERHCVYPVCLYVCMCTFCPAHNFGYSSMGFEMTWQKC